MFDRGPKSDADIFGLVSVDMSSGPLDVSESDSVSGYRTVAFSFVLLSVHESGVCLRGWSFSTTPFNRETFSRASLAFQLAGWPNLFIYLRVGRISFILFLQLNNYQEGA